MTPSICVPAKELKNTQQFAETVQNSEGPVIVTKNGRESFVSMSMDCYRSLCLESARARLYDSLDRAEADISSGGGVDADELIGSIRNRYGI